MPESSQDHENTQEGANSNPATATSDDVTVAATATATTDADAGSTKAIANEDADDANTDASGEGTGEMQDRENSNDEAEAEAEAEADADKDGDGEGDDDGEDEGDGDGEGEGEDEGSGADETSKGNDGDLAPEPNIDENTILLPVAGENGFVAEDTAIGFNASDFLQEEEDVIDPMSTNQREERAISQVPKKRRIPDSVNYDDEEEELTPERNGQKRRGRKPGTKVINGQVIYPSDQMLNEMKTNSPRVKLHSMSSVTLKSVSKLTGKVSLGQVDENQCRVCTSPNDLVSIFKKEFQKTYADKLMLLCPAVNIQRKDFLPQYICRVCVSSVNAAFALKIQCEETDMQLRGELEATVKKVRKVPSYVDSDPEDIPDVEQNDQDFKLSDASPPPSDEDSDSDYSKPLLKRPRRGRRSSSGKRKSHKKMKSPSIKKEKMSPLKKGIKHDPDMNDSKELDDGARRDFSSGSEEDYSPPKRRRGRKSRMREGRDSSGLTCNICHETLSSREELKEHKKSMHTSFDCELCGRKFKMQSSLKTHMEKHTSLKILNCEPCNMHFPNKTERRRHMQEHHKESVAQYSCEKCKRAFTSETRLQKHTESNCPGFDTSQKKRGDLDSLSMGKDLFKCVAPLTTTYWSDSFSD